MSKTALYRTLGFFTWLCILSLACRLSFIEAEDQLTFEEVERTYAVQTIVVNLTQTVTTPTSVPPTRTLTSTLRPLPSRTNTVPVPVSTEGSTLTPTPPPCDLAGFVRDVTVPDGTNYYPGDRFTKTWRIQNIGSCTWTKDYRVVFSSGDRLSSPDYVLLPGEVKPQQSVDISVDLYAPDEQGRYRGNWKLQNEDGKTFSLPDGSPFYIDILVVEPEEGAVVYSFAENYCEAEWSSTASGLEALPCPGERSDERGYVYRWADPRLENGAYPNANGLEMHPTWESHLLWDADKDGGWIKGVYTGVRIEPGSHFMTTIGCLYGASTCDVNFSLQYRIAENPWAELGAWHQTGDGSVEVIDIDLADFVGLDVDFIYWVDANSNGGLDQAIWVNPRIEN